MMVPFLIISAVLALGVGIVLWATRRRPHLQTTARSASQAGSTPEEPSVPVPALVVEETVDPFGHVPYPADRQENRA